MPSVTLKGNPVTLSGKELKVGDKAPAFTVQSPALSDVSLDSAAGKTRIVVTVPSVDTPVCHAETRRFNEEAAKLPNVAIFAVSMDLPFAQKRWCAAEGVDKVQVLSDHRSGKMGEDYGVLIKGGPLDRCLARAIFVVGPDDKIKHVEYVKEITEHPNYEAALASAKGPLVYRLQPAR
jgi:thioredoxin-dependent peroxiredoxin